MLRRLKCYSWVLLVILITITTSCDNENELYERPSYLKGNAWEVLTDRGDFTIFLAAVEKAGYKDLLNGKGILTVMAPNDNAMKEYLSSNNYTSINDISSEELKKLVGFHLLYYSFTKSMLANYQPDGSVNASSALYGMYFKFRTHSKDSIESTYDVTTEKYKDVYHKERFLPIFSSYIFNTKGIDAEYNYEYFYPNSTWKGTDGGFNVSNASVSEYAIPTDNGYVYLINSALEPLETVHKELTKQSDYSEFITMYDRFSNFVYSSDLTADYATSGDSLYLFEHNGLPYIASEWSYNGESSLADYADLATLAYKAFNVFAPKNSALESFFSSYWSGYYNSISEVDFLPIKYLLDNHVYQGSIVFPGEIKNNTIKSSYNSTISFDPDADVSYKKICSNGTIYGLTSVIVPPMFKSITGPVFRDPRYKIFMYMLDKTSMVQPLMSSAINEILFIPTDTAITSVTFQGSSIYWDEGDSKVYGDESISVDGTSGQVAMSTSAMKIFVYNHIATDLFTTVSNIKVYHTMNSFSYLYLSDSGVQSTDLFENSTYVKPTNLGSWSNGNAYKANNALVKDESVLKSVFSLSTDISKLGDYSSFINLLTTAGYNSADSITSLLGGENFVIFAPNNTSIASATDIPTSKADLKLYLKKYFIPVSTNNLSDYFFAGTNCSGTFKTIQKISGTTTSIKLTDDGTSLKVQIGSGNTATIVNALPRIYSDGALYLIDSVL
jgi:uncharacterized surface protein with fasciclin (FAS1) repeats